MRKFALALFTLIIIGGGLFLVSNDNLDILSLNEAVAESVPSQVPSSNEEQKDEELEEQQTEETEDDTQAKNTGSKLDIEKALSVRGIGNPEAPVVIEEYASLTCRHCATFHKEVFPKLKEEFIDTGRVYFIFNDFPLNGPALDAAILARCVPEEFYFRYLKLLFDTQADWAYEKNYRDVIQSHAKLIGTNDALMKECLSNQELRSKLYEGIRESGAKKEIKSTPSFLINGKLEISGSKPIDAFRMKIEKAEKEVTAKQAE